MLDDTCARRRPHRKLTVNMDHRRPLKSRSTAWARAVAQVAVRSGVTPNQISLLSVVFAAGGAWALLHPKVPLALLAAALMVQLRLLCNLIDGMVAVEGGRGSATGPLYNEIPDRLADSLFLVAAGFAVGLPDLGWLAALAAAVTAYIRVLGGTLGLPQDFRGPQAKPHRMALLTLACLAGAVEAWLRPGGFYALTGGLGLIALGTLLTCVTRTRAIAAALRARAAVTSGH